MIFHIKSFYQITQRRSRTCAEVGIDKEEVTITNANIDHFPIAMNVVLDLENKTDLILIFRPNLRFYKNGEIEDVIQNIDDNFLYI